MDLITFIEHALIELNHIKSAELGDRMQYIGSSDVGSCPRKVCLQKSCLGGEPDLTTMLKFSRGHVAETLLIEIFNAGGVKQLYDTQVELRHPVYPLLQNKNKRRKVDYETTPITLFIYSGTGLIIT